jgi:hypothetical protein
LWIRGPRTMAIRRESRCPCFSCSSVRGKERPQSCPHKVKLSCSRFAIRRASRDAVHVCACKARVETARLDAIRKRPTDPRSGLRGGFLSHKVKMGIGLSSLNGKNEIELERYFSSLKSHIKRSVTNSESRDRSCTVVMVHVGRRAPCWVKGDQGKGPGSAGASVRVYTVGGRFRHLPKWRAPPS